MRLRQTGHKRKLTWSIKKPRTIDKLTQELEHKLNFQRNGTKIQKTKNRNGTKLLEQRVRTMTVHTNMCKNVNTVPREGSS